MEKFLESFYCKTGTLNRMQYFTRRFALVLAVSFIFSVTLFLGVIAFFAGFYFDYHLIQQRLRSMGRNTENTIYWFLGVLVPVLGIIPSLFLYLTAPKSNKSNKRKAV